jgi:hypothetical protein
MDIFGDVFRRGKRAFGNLTGDPEEIIRFEGPPMVLDHNGRPVSGMVGLSTMAPRKVINAYWNFSVPKNLVRGPLFGYGGDYFFDVYPDYRSVACLLYVWDGEGWVDRGELER